MKKIFFLIIICSGGQLLPGQTAATLQLHSGVHLKSEAGTYLVLNDVHLVNNGGVIQQAIGQGVVRFTGGAAVTVSGTDPIQIDKVELAKQAGSVLGLGRDIGVGTMFTFNSGLLNLNNFIVDLGSGQLLGESEQSRAYTTGSGFIQATGILNKPSQTNLGNLGAVITSPANLGSTIIRRGHAIQTGIGGANNSIQRYYDFIPANNNNLKATLRIIYFDAELNGLAENNLYQWKTKNNTTWDLVGADSRDAVANYVERKNISKLERMTLAIATAPVITCPQNYTVSANLSGCKASVNLTGNSGAIATGLPAPIITYSINGSPIASTYTFSKGTTTVTAVANNDVTPTASCTFTVTVVCGPVTMAAAQAPVSEQINPVGKLSVTALPNPSDNYFTLRASSANTQAVSVRVFDVLGRLVEQRSNLAVNLTVSLGHQYRPGVYVVEVVQGKERVVVRLIKR